MTDERIQRGLQDLFDQHRIVFWYDAKQELREAYEGVELENVEKIEIRNNEFGLKVRMLRQEPEQKFLVYKEGPEPDPPTENWLLDIQLAHAVFHADQVSMWLSELGLGFEARALIENHADFFRAQKRLNALKKILGQDDTRRICEKMLFVCAGSDPDFGAMVETLLDEHANGKDERLKLIERVGLNEFLWDQIARRYGYVADTPSVEDFALALFKSALAQAIGKKPALNSDAVIFYKRWKANRHGAVVFEALSSRYADILNIQGTLENTDWRKFQEFDGFEEVDRAVIRGLVGALTEKALPRWDVEDVVASRRNSHWHEKYKLIYEAVSEAARFFHLIAAADLKIDTFEDGIAKYVASWFEIDQAYRKYTIAARSAGQPSLTQALSEEVENLYTNKFLLPLGDAWQRHIDALEKWGSKTINNQGEFYRKTVRSYRQRNRKVCVIISDAMRYEIGDELSRRIRSLDRYDAVLAPMLAALPTYTQLGMAALLPHKTLSFAKDGDGALVLADGQSTQGQASRSRILRAAESEEGACALRADDFLKLNKEEARAVTRDHAVVFIYHNQIDATGDKRDTEERTFNAVEDALSDVEAIVRKLSGANASHILITADHGFLFQQRPLDESDFSAGEFDSKAAKVVNRRFVIGRNFKETVGFRQFTSDALNLAPGFEILIPKSINRLRLKGAGSRFVHGGATLQEAIIPLITVTKTRQNDVTQVEVEVISSGTRVITTNQFSVRFYQDAPISEKAAMRTLVIGLFASDGELISDEHKVVFDAESNDVRDREKTIRFLLASNAASYNEQDVFLKLREQHEGTTHFKDYRQVVYRLRNRISGDFDF